MFGILATYTWILHSPIAGRTLSRKILLSHDSFGFSRDGRVLPWKLLDVNCSILQRQPTIRQIVSYGEELQEAAVKGMRIAYLSMWLPETKSLKVN
ncbi:hypothetical protein HMPREF1619_05950 [Klebsiella pneumoniae 909957]|nr:hypothetical protein HMPREF1619_05950 [Klebsiella pneumoniae 909957]